MGNSQVIRPSWLRNIFSESKSVVLWRPQQAAQRLRTLPQSCGFWRYGIVLWIVQLFFRVRTTYPTHHHVQYRAKFGIWDNYFWIPGSWWFSWLEALFWCHQTPWMTFFDCFLWSQDKGCVLPSHFGGAWLTLCREWTQQMSSTFKAAPPRGYDLFSRLGFTAEVSHIPSQTMCGNHCDMNATR